VVNKTSFYLTHNEPWGQFKWHEIKQRNTFTSNSKKTGCNWNQSDTSNIFRLTCVKLTTALENFKGVVSDYLSFASVEIDKNCGSLYPVGKFVSQAVTWPATTRVFLPRTKGGRDERPWERGCQILIKYDKQGYLSQFFPEMFDFLQ